MRTGRWQRQPLATTALPAPAPRGSCISYPHRVSQNPPPGHAYKEIPRYKGVKHKFFLLLPIGQPHSLHRCWVALDQEKPCRPTSTHAGSMQAQGPPVARVCSPSQCPLCLDRVAACCCPLLYVSAARLGAWPALFVAHPPFLVPRQPACSAGAPHEACFTGGAAQGQLQLLPASDTCVAVWRCLPPYGVALEARARVGEGGHVSAPQMPTPCARPRIPGNPAQHPFLLGQCCPIGCACW